MATCEPALPASPANADRQAGRRADASMVALIQSNVWLRRQLACQPTYLIAPALEPVDDHHRIRQPRPIERAIDNRRKL